MEPVNRVCKCGHIFEHHCQVTPNFPRYTCGIEGCPCEWFEDFKPVSLIDSELKALMERYLAGDWRNEPDGGACHAIKLAYNLGRKETSEDMAALCMEWHFYMADQQVAHEREMAMKEEQINALIIELTGRK